jgi:hypothetical protein
LSYGQPESFSRQHPHQVQKSRGADQIAIRTGRRRSILY